MDENVKKDGEYLEALACQVEHGEEIEVTDIVNGVLGKYKLSELPPEKAILHIWDWVRAKKIPLRVVAA